MRTFFKDAIIVCDRYFYQLFFDLFRDFGKNVVKIFPRPDVTFFLDGDLEVLRSRMTSSFDKAADNRYYESAKEFYKRVLNNCIKINASLSKREVNEVIFENLRRVQKNFARKRFS
jgi:thymidylate kinase